MVKAFFSRKVPLYLLPADTHPDQLFDAYPVEVPEEALKFIVATRSIITDMEEAFDENPAPEDAAQFEADFLVQLVGYGNNGE